MNLLRYVRETLISRLWASYRNEVKHAKVVDEGIQAHIQQDWVIDHLAIIDLPSAKSGIKIMQPLFSLLGYEMRGEGYLPEKQNGFMWMAEVGSENQPAAKVLPQIVIADFELNELPHAIREIIEKYTKHLPDHPLAEVEALSQQAREGNQVAADHLIERLVQYFSIIDRPLSSIADFKAVEAFNELLAWCLAFGRKPNHFTVGVHLLEHVKHLSEFNQWVQQQLNLPMNTKEALIKGGMEQGVEQSSTQGEQISFQLADGVVKIPDRFMEFIWRFPQKAVSEVPMWGEYFTGFIAAYANRVIESLYKEEATDGVRS